MYLALDTCIWLELLKEVEDNIFEEICYWIENNYITHITPSNCIKEWERNKLKKTLEVINGLKTINERILKPFRNNTGLTSTYQPTVIEDVITARVVRVENILKNLSEVAEDSQEVRNEAHRRAVECLAPNHLGDSYRDTINIISLIAYIKSKGYTNVVFSTINYKEFSKGKHSKHDLHPDLLADFNDVGLKYVYCDESPFANTLINSHLRPHLPSYIKYLKDEQKKQEEQKLEERKLTQINAENLDQDFLENIKHIDVILAKENPTPFELKIIKLFKDEHESYEKYILRNIK